MNSADHLEDTDYEGEWYAFEGGASVNEDGEHGVVLRDEELGDEEDPEATDARLTLEQGRAENPGFFVTATLYGWLFTVAKRQTAPEAHATYDAMQNDLSRMVLLIPYEEDGKKRIEQKAEALLQAVADFEERYTKSVGETV